VINLDFPGANTAELAARFDSALKMHPKIVVVMAGANDALNPAKLLPPEASRKNLEFMVTRANDTGVQIVLVNLHDPDFARLLARHKLTEYGDTPPEQRVSDINRVLREVALVSGIALGDFHAVLEGKGGATVALSTDGLHLMRDGYALLASAVHTQLPEHDPDSDTIVCFGDSLTYGIGVRAENAPETDDTYPAKLRALLRADHRASGEYNRLNVLSSGDSERRRVVHAGAIGGACSAGSEQSALRPSRDATPTSRISVEPPYGKPQRVRARH
jgi:acyl-CoA thioesterase-1